MSNEKISAILCAAQALAFVWENETKMNSPSLYMSLAKMLHPNSLRFLNQMAGLNRVRRRVLICSFL